VRVFNRRPRRPRFFQRQLQHQRRTVARLQNTRPRRPGPILHAAFLVLDFADPVRGVRAAYSTIGGPRTSKHPSEPSENPGLDGLSHPDPGDPDPDPPRPALAGQGINPLPVLPVAREHAAAELPIGGNSEVLTLLVLPLFGAGRAACSLHPVGQVHHLLELFHVQAHELSPSVRNFTPLNPRWFRSSRFTSCRLVTPNSSSISPSSLLWTSVIGSGCHLRSGQ